VGAGAGWLVGEGGGGGGWWGGGGGGGVGVGRRWEGGGGGGGGLTTERLSGLAKQALMLEDRGPNGKSNEVTELKQ